MPRYGGTLRYFGPGGMDHLDQSSAYYALSHQIIRLFARQLFGCPTRVDHAGLIAAPDVAVRILTPGNGLSADRRTYTIELRPGVYWDTDPPREVTAADFVRGLKADVQPSCRRVHSPNAGGAVQKLGVRRAIAYAVDKAAIAEIFDAMGIGTEFHPAHTAIPPGNFGYREHNRYPTPGDRGDRPLSRELLEEAGYGDGLTLKLLYREADVHPQVARSIMADLAECGVAVELVATSQSDEYYRVLQDPSRAKAGEWDITAPSWTPDWFSNNGRAYVQPMFQSNSTAGTANYGGMKTRRSIGSSWRHWPATIVNEPRPSCTRSTASSWRTPQSCRSSCTSRRDRT